MWWSPPSSATCSPAAPRSTPTSSPTTRSRTTPGRRHRDTHQVLRSLDRSIALIAAAARYAPAPVPHRAALRPRPEPRRDLPGALRAEPGRPRTRRVRAAGAAARAGARRAAPRPGRRRAPPCTGRRRAEGHQLLPTRSCWPPGNLGLVSFPDVPGRITREELDRRHPALLATLANHPGIGFVLVRSAEHGAVVLGPAGAEHHLDTGHVVGTDPLAPLRGRRGRSGAPHRPLPAHRRPHGQLRPRPGDRRGARLRGADRLARRPGRRPEPPLPALARSS